MTDEKRRTAPVFEIKPVKQENSKKAIAEIVKRLSELREKNGTKKKGD